MIAEKSLEVKKKKGQEYWHVTQKGVRKISFLTLPIFAYAILLGIGLAFIVGGVWFGYYGIPLQPSGQIGVGAIAAIFGGFLFWNQRRLEKELLKLEGQDDSDES